MEDQKRGMDSRQKQGSPLKERPVNPRQLTVIIMRSVGKMRSFNISRRALLWTSLFFLAYILVSLYTFNSFFNLRHRYEIQSNELQQLEEELNESETMLARTRNYVTGLEEYIENASKQEEKETTSVQNENQSRAIRGKTEVLNVDRDGGDKGDLPSFVDVADFVIKREDSGMNVDFRLVNTIETENAVEGYIHIIAMDEGNEYPSEWNNARDKLQNGLPVDFRRGQPFFIQRFKSYHRQFNMNSNSELPGAIKVLVYNQSGELILKKEFEVDNES
jgi:hypothetical protein